MPAPVITPTVPPGSSIVQNEGGGQTIVPDAPVVSAPVVPAGPIAPPATTPITTPTPSVPTAPVNVMPASALGSNASTFSTYTPTPTASVNLSESAVAAKDAAVANVAKEADTLQTQQTQGKGGIMDIFAKLGAQATAKFNAEDNAGLNTDRKAIDELTSQIEATGRSFDKQIAAVQNNNPNGALDSGVQIEVNRLNQQKASTQADLAIVLSAKTRSYDTAKSIIDTKVDAETEDLKNTLTGLQFFYQENAANLNKDQQVVLQDKIKTADNALQDARDMRTKIGDLQLTAAKNGAPLSVVRAIGSAADFETATSAAGGYLKTASAAADAYSAADKRLVKQAGLVNASQRTQDVFVNTPTAFQQEFIRNGSGTGDATPENIIKSLADWEATQGNGNVDALVKQLQSGG